MSDGLSVKELFNKNKGTGLTYDDLILLPGFINFTVDDVKLKSRISKNIYLNAPICSSPMVKINY
jgi:IMP dehydrogenase